MIRSIHRRRNRAVKIGRRRTPARFNVLFSNQEAGGKRRVKIIAIFAATGGSRHKNLFSAPVLPPPQRIFGSVSSRFFPVLDGLLHISRSRRNIAFRDVRRTNSTEGDQVLVKRVLGRWEGQSHPAVTRKAILAGEQGARKEMGPVIEAGSCRREARANSGRHGEHEDHPGDDRPLEKYRPARPPSVLRPFSGSTCHRRRRRF